MAFFAEGVIIRSWEEVHQVQRRQAYAGSLLTIFGVGFALQSWIAVLLMAGIFIAVFGYRISVEEKALVRSLGEEYLLYSTRLKRLVPYVF